MSEQLLHVKICEPAIELQCLGVALISLQSNYYCEP